MLKSIKAIDVHAHINTGTVYDNEESTFYSAYVEHINKMRIAANVEKVFCSTFASVKIPNSHMENPNLIEQENELMYSLSKENDYLYQWVVIDPRIKGTFEQAKKMLDSKKCVGIKLHPPFHKYTLAEWGDKIFSLASEFSAVVLIHPEGKATHILPMADKYPGVKFIMAHLNGCYDDHISAIKYAKNGNVYTDIATAGSIRNNSVEYAVSEIGSEKILFGTDTYAAGALRGRVEYAIISDSDKENILRNNAVRLFEDKLR